MTPAEATDVVATALSRIAPEVQLDALDPDGSLRDEADLDSMDFLALVEALHDATGVDIPEADYGRVGSLQELVSYLVAHTSDR